jgi:glyoxylase-like metal-dependent hydrolase (beta-lactamase superfamily II)
MTVSVLEITFNNTGHEAVLCPVVLHNENEVVLVDCGYPGFMPLIEDAMQQHGLSLEQATGIIITHDDIDHVGALYEIKDRYPQIKVYSSVLEGNYISGKEKSPRLIQAESMEETLPENQRQRATQFIAMLKAVRPLAVDTVLYDNEEPSFLPGVQIIYTPGHMPGHFSLYVKANKTLIAADAVVVENGHLEIANPQFTLNLQQAVASVKKMEELDIERLICYHGGAVDNDIKTQLKNLIAKYADV